MMRERLLLTASDAPRAVTLAVPPSPLRVWRVCGDRRYGDWQSCRRAAISEAASNGRGRTHAHRRGDRWPNESMTLGCPPVHVILAGLALVSAQVPTVVPSPVGLAKAREGSRVRRFIRPARCKYVRQFFFLTGACPILPHAALFKVAHDVESPRVDVLISEGRAAIGTRQRLLF